MADALVSPPIAAVAGVVAITLIAAAAKEVKNSRREGMVSMMGIMGAFVFAAQMINFTIPGTGSSGHIIGGVLLAAMLGPWCAFLTLTSVLIVQCLVFADGGLMALGCNIVNMGAMSCLIAYPLVFRPIVRNGMSNAKLMFASVAACVIGLEAGAVMVTLETVASGVTALPMGEFLWFMLPIHLAIGAVEGVATGLVLVFVRKQSPELLQGQTADGADMRQNGHRNLTLTVIGVLTLVFALGFFWMASENPDGLEWSILQITGDTEIAPAMVPSTAFMPDYASHFSGILGGVIVMAMIWALSMIIFRKRSQPTI